ncbi:TIGR02206 family membrane protein [Flexivirga meconopsidis]|uniref:YwaF family protein n=1 Tax=Flexivirga meconopsidis TaxID=2977121 RepID=UPI00223EEA82|nr:TIGR02206 family membrane protein [Flexivirga meconopsidis]
MTEAVGMTQREFATFGTSHLVVLAIFVVGAVGLVWLGRNQSQQQARGFSRAAAIVFAVTFVAGTVDKLMQRATLSELPLQLSDVSEIVAAYALWSGRHWAFGLTYFWALVLGSQALITPDLDSGDFPDSTFFSFFLLHLFLVWTAIYLAWGRRMRPTWRDYRCALLATVAWAALAMIFNALAGTNFGFLNRKPDSGSVLDYMGPWPTYLAVEALVLLVLWALMTWPWQRSRALTQVNPERP